MLLVLQGTLILSMSRTVIRVTVYINNCHPSTETSSIKANGKHKLTLNTVKFPHSQVNCTKYTKVSIIHQSHKKAMVVFNSVIQAGTDSMFTASYLFLAFDPTISISSRKSNMPAFAAVRAPEAKAFLQPSVFPTAFHIPLTKLLTNTATSRK